MYVSPPSRPSSQLTYKSIDLLITYKSLYTVNGYTKYLYVDNVTPGCQSEGAILHYYRSKSKANFKLRCWALNSQQLATGSSKADEVLDSIIQLLTYILELKMNICTDTIAFVQEQIKSKGKTEIVLRSILQNSMTCLDNCHSS